MNEVKKFDLITVGDSTVDTFIKIHDATVECDINHESCKICIPYGAKIPVDSIGHGVAGNAANVAVGCSKLDLATAIYTNLGDDDHGKNIASVLSAQKVASDYIQINPGRGSNLSVVLSFQGERTIFVYHQQWQYRLPDLARSSWLYLTSMAPSFTKGNIMDEVCHYVDKVGAKMVFNPGTHQLKADIKRFPKVLERCTVLVVNLEEAKLVLEVGESEKVGLGDILSKMLFLGPRMIVVTDAEEGSYATDGQSNFKAGILPTRVVEKTGAGDAYTSGLLAGLSRGLVLEEAMVWGTINASSVIQVLGAQNGLLSRAEIEKIRRGTDLKVVKF